jgi:FkbM family methyltransferase
MEAASALPASLRWKHLIATSPLAAPARALRAVAGRLRTLLRPELGLLLQEDRFLDACLARLVQSNWHCVDVGAHIGAVSHRLSRLAPRGRLTIVEPRPAATAALRARFPQAVLHQAAVSDRAGEAVFHENVAHPAFSSLSDRAMRGPSRAIPVQLARLDDLMRDERVDFLKLDVEGHEPAALLGAEDVLRTRQPVVLFEAGAKDDPDLDDSAYDRMFVWLQGLGFAIRPVFHQYFGREAIDLAAFSACRRYPFTAFNFLAIPGDRA